MNDTKAIETYKAVKLVEVSEALIASFVDFLDVTPLTVKTYKAGIGRLIAYCHTAGITSPQREDVSAFKKSLVACGCKPATVAAYLSAIRRFFDWTESEGLYPNITRGIKAPKIDKGHKRDFLTAPQIQSMMNGIDTHTVEGKRNFAILALMATGGLRTVEVMRANVEDLSTAGGLPVLFVQGKGRTDKKDFVKLTPEVLKALREYLEARGQVNRKEPLFVSCSHRNRGGRLTTRTISGIAKASMISAGYYSDRLTAHSLRHSAVTIALMAGQSLAEVQYFARHSNISTTQIYAHNVDRLRSGCEASISNAIFHGLYGLKL